MSSIFDGLASTFVAVLGDDEQAVYSKADGSWSGAVSVIFDRPSTLMATGSGPDAVTRETRFHAEEACLPAGYGAGDTIAFRNETWTVSAALADGHGMVELRVEVA